MSSKQLDSLSGKARKPRSEDSRRKHLSQNSTDSTSPLISDLSDSQRSPSLDKQKPSSARTKEGSGLGVRPSRKAPAAAKKQSIHERAAPEPRVSPRATNPDTIPKAEREISDHPSKATNTGKGRMFNVAVETNVCVKTRRSSKL